ncbi:MAG TPA: cytochrome c oxidase assembly protein [Acidimicrobiales bacterium]|nr:cytochrome c oxidase assembly protein [Acidimicrobiales bacterium]
MTTTSGSPWSFHPHPVAWALVVAVVVGYAVAVRRPGWAAGRRQVWAFAGGAATLLVAASWPLADLAAHWLLVALVLQRLLLMVAAPALFLLGLPQPVVVAATRPAPVDAAVRVLSRPPVAVVVVTAVAVGTLTTGAVDAQSSSVAARAGLDLLVLASGFVLWLPVLLRLPGTPRPSALGRGGYLIAQSIVPSFLAVVWIFAHHPLYPTYGTHGRVLGLAPVADQQIAGFVAKLGTIAALWTVAFVVITRSQQSGPAPEEEPLTWADVERQLERVARHERRHGGGPAEPADVAGPAADPGPEGDRPDG